jgi:pilus assembly protein Flp/PilA
VRPFAHAAKGRVLSKTYIQGKHMTSFFNSLKAGVADFLKEDDGAQVVEYALIIAVVSIGLVILLSGLLGSGNAFETFVTRVKACLGTNTCV